MKGNFIKIMFKNHCIHAWEKSNNKFTINTYGNFQSWEKLHHFRQKALTSVRKSILPKKVFTVRIFYCIFSLNKHHLLGAKIFFQQSKNTSYSNLMKDQLSLNLTYFLMKYIFRITRKQFV